MATRSIHRLSSLDVKRATKRGMYCDGGGLYLQVSRDGSRSWVFRFRLGPAVRRHLGLGAVHSVSLAQARELAAAARRQLLARKDPVETRRTETAEFRLAVAKTMTFRQAAAAFVTSKSPGWKKHHTAQWIASLTRHAFPVIGDLSVQAIDTTLMMRVLEPLWTKNTETASRVRSRIESILDWAKVRGFRDGDNPARWQGHLDHLLPPKSSVTKVKHHPAMPHAELPAFMTALRAAATPAARALKFTILTASRSGEVLGADWSEIDIATKTWTVPAARMKEKRTHCVPLSDAAIAALGTPGTGLIFSGTRPGHQLNKNAFMELLRRAGHGVTAHGFRSTFRDWAAEQTDFAFEVVEMALAHKVGNEVSRAYFRSDLFDRRFLMDAWASFCAGVEQADNVRPMRRA